MSADAAAAAPVAVSVTPTADDAARSLITQVERPATAARTNKTSWVPPRLPPPPAPRKLSFFQRLCACCFSAGSVGSEESGTAAVPSTAAVPLTEKPLVLRPRPKPALVPGALLPPQPEELAGRKTLVLDLDETLVHSSFKSLPTTDFQIEVEIDGMIHPVYVAKRPRVDEFLKRMGELFEVVVFTASLAKYADPVMDRLDVHKVVSFRLFREACSNHQGVYVKDLSRLGRPLKDVIIIDNSPTSYLFHPENAVPIGSWFDDRSDTELMDLIPFLEALTKVDDVCSILDPSNSA